MNDDSLIVIVEDEAKLVSLLEDYLQQSGYRTHCIANGNEVIPWIKQHHPALVLLDIMLPGRDGLSICKELRSFSALPVIMMTARVDEIDRLIGLDLGADDYICKPFSPRELVARVQAVLRRCQPATTATEGFAVDHNRQQLVFRGQVVDFTAVEFQLLAKLASETGRIFSRAQLMTAMYNDNRVVSDRTIDSHIKKLRKRLDEAFPETEFIQSVYGSGYRFDIPAQ